jgi:hypothetical protein
MDVPNGTLDGLGDPSADTVATWVRRTVLTVLALVVICGGVGLLGVHTSTASASKDGYQLTLRYPRTARAGLDTAWQVRVRHPGGFGKKITIAVTGDYFDIFETQGFHPDVSDSTRDGRTLYLTFNAPPTGDTFVVDYDAYIQPASQRGRRARVTLMHGAHAVVSVNYQTTLFP